MKAIFSSSNLPLALLIRFFTGCKWHHCGVLVGDIVYESRVFIGFGNLFEELKRYFKNPSDNSVRLGGVIETPLKDFIKRGDYLILDLNLKDEDSALCFVKEQVGKGYDWTGILAYPFDRDWQNPSSWSCSEYLAATCKAGLKPKVRDDVNCITPRDLWVSSL